MKRFYKNVDTRSRRAMIDFLSKHFRYDTMNSWNASTSYANDVKITHLDLTSEQIDTLFDMTQTSDFYDELHYVIDEFNMSHDYRWQVGFNGRNSGYLVLYQGYSKRSEWKSFCTECGQRNFKTIAETAGSRKCGRCGRESRVDYITSPLETGVYCARSTDMNEDFEDWSIDDLRARVKLVQEFDKLCDAVVECAVGLAEDYEAVEETVMVPQTIKTLQPKGATV